KYYSISFEEPSAPEDIFIPETSIEQAKLYMDVGNPPSLLTNVNYGRIFILTFETTENKDDFQAALNSTFSGWLADGSINFQSTKSNIIRNSEIKIFAIGGDAKKIAKVITSDGRDKLAIMNEYITDGAEFSQNSTGVPIGYKAIYIANNTVAAINSSTKYQKVYCEPAAYRKPLKLTVEKFVTRDVTDDDEDMEFSYTIQFLGQNNEVVDQLSNRKPVTYVEEPSKVKKEDHRNKFFVGDSKTVNKPIFKINLIVWARSD